MPQSEATSGTSNEKIASDLNAGTSLPHNFGRPKDAPIQREGATQGATHYVTDCKKENLESLSCIEKNYSNRSACESFFAAYKECRQAENERRKENNANKSWWSRGFVANRSPVSPTVTKVAAHAGDQLGLLSFDLDDTLFHTGKVVRAANDVMIEAMQERGCEELALPEYLDTTRSVRKALSAPITYRVLRELAIRTSFEQSKVFQSAGKNVDAYVQDCYKVWEKERHLAAERFIFEDAVRTLEQLRSLYPDACFAAITNGAGNPLMMPNTLAPFFDFRVSGEDPDVFPNRKPHAYIYEYSLEKYQQLSGSNSKGTWCHVGDCLANDVGASAACGAKAIWMCLSDDDDTAAARLLDPKVYPEWSTASKEEIEKRIREVEAGMSKVTAKIGTLSELPDALADILTGATVVK